MSLSTSDRELDHIWNSELYDRSRKALNAAINEYNLAINDSTNVMVGGMSAATA